MVYLACFSSCLCNALLRILICFHAQDPAMLSSFVSRSSRFFHQPTTTFATSSSYSRSSSQFATRTICLATQQSLLCIIFWARSPLDLGSWPAVVLNACCLVSYFGSNASDVSLSLQPTLAHFALCALHLCTKPTRHCLACGGKHAYGGDF